MLSLPVVGKIVQPVQNPSFSVPWVAVWPAKSPLPGCFAGCGMCGALWSRQPRLNPRIRLGTKAQGYRQAGENHWNLTVLEYNKKKKKKNSKCCTELLSSEPGSQNNYLSVGKINYQSLSDPNVMLGQINPLLYCYSALIIFLYIPGAGTKKHFAVSANTIIRIVLTKWHALSWLSEIHFSGNYRCFFTFHYH